MIAPEQVNSKEGEGKRRAFVEGGLTGRPCLYLDRLQIPMLHNHLL